jgi:predicted acylesterase/phospholipase RssA
MLPDADPTAAAHLQALKAEVLSEIGADPKFLALKDAPPALVLTGGGGKGAFEAGVMLALYDCGIDNFATIGGTSVGALNAALCQQLVRKRARGLVVGLWSQLTFSKVLKLTPKSLLKLALYLPLSAVAHLDLLERAKTLLEGDVEIDDARDWLKRALYGSLGVAAAGAVSLGSFAAMFVLLNPLFARFGLSPKAAMLLAFLACTWLIPALAGLLGRRLGIASNSPLRRTIGLLDIADVRVGQPEVVCTLASQPGYRRKKSVAFYPSLKQTDSTALATDILLQSAALPEVFPLRAVYGGEFVDGGIADNTPILGIANSPTTKVIVVYLDHRMERLLERYRRWGFGMFRANDGPAWTRSSALQAREARRLAELATRRGENWEDFRAWFYAAELIPIIPIRSLGNFLTGTLNFTAAKANRLVADGYADTLRQLRSWCRERPSAEGTPFDAHGTQRNEAT